MRRRTRGFAVAAVAAVMVAPVVIDRDSFPLSTYPMYARTRAAEVSFVTAQGVTDDGELVRLSLGTIGSSDDPLVVAGELRAAVRSGEGDSQCAAIAKRVENSDRAVDRIIGIEVVTERHDTVVSLEGGDSLVDRTVHARCEIDR